MENHILYVQESPTSGNKELITGNLSLLRKQGKKLVKDNHRVFIQYSNDYRKRTGWVSETV